MVSSKWIVGSEESKLEDVKSIRRAVFSEEFDKDDINARHVLVSNEGTPAATGRLVIKQGVHTLGKIAVLPEFRGKLLGDLVLRMLIRAAYNRGGNQQWLQSPPSACAFFERLGFVKKEEKDGLITMLREGDITGACNDSR